MTQTFKPVAAILANGAIIEVVADDMTTGQINRSLVLMVLMDDELIHTDKYPFCNEFTCPCHEPDEVMLAPSTLDCQIEEGYNRIARNLQRLEELL